MPGPSVKPLQPTAAQLKVLHTLARQHTAAQRLARRVRIILAAAQGRGLTDTARRLELSPSTVQSWRDRWLEAADRLAAHEDDPVALAQAITETLSDAPRSGTPVSFSPQAVAQIIALACENPTRFGREVSHWTPTELADEAVKQGIVASISPRSVGRFLKRGRPQTASEPVLAPS